MGTYICKYPEMNCFYTDVKPDTVFGELAETFKAEDIDFKVRDDKWKLTFNYPPKTVKK